MSEIEIFSGVRIASPDQAWTLAFCFLVLIFWLIRKARFARHLQGLVHERNQSFLVKDRLDWQKNLRSLLPILALFFISLSLLQPKWGFQWQEIQRKGVDVMIAVDVSQSMMAEDLKPNRLVRAKRKIMDLLGLVQGDRIGLIAFAGTSYLQCPLTLDYGAFSMFLDLLGPDLIPQQGTAIDEAILQATAAFEEGTQKSRALILITDGEEHSGSYLQAARDASELGVRIYTLGIGSPEGVPIPHPDLPSATLKDESGNIVITRLNEDILKQIAQVSGGAYVRATAGDQDLRQIYEGEILQKLEMRDLKSTRRKNFENRFQFFLGIALILLFLEPFFTKIQWLSSSGKLAKTLSFALFFGMASSSSADIGSIAQYFGFASEQEQQTREALKDYKQQQYEESVQKFSNLELINPEEEVYKYNLANSLYKAGDFNQALGYYSQLSNSRNADMALASKYNEGNSFFKLGKWEEAAKSYESVLQQDPNHERARQNLELVKKLMEQHQQQQQQQGQDSQENQDESSKDQQQQGEQKQSQENQNENQSQENQKDNQSQGQENKGEESKQNQNPERGQDKESGEDKADKNQENQKGDSKEEKEKKESGKEEEQPKSGENEKKQESQARQDGEQKEGNDSEVQRIKKLSPEEAQRFLNRLSSDSREQLKKYIQYRLRNKPASPGTEGKKW